MKAPFLACINCRCLFVAAIFTLLVLNLNPQAYSQTASPVIVFGPVSIGSTSTATAVQLTFNNATSLGGVTVLTQGSNGLDFTNAGLGSCSLNTGPGGGGQCTVNVTFSPLFAGVRNGAVTLADGSGKILATSYLTGVGTGPQINFLPPTEVVLPSSALVYPAGIAVDGAGNIYIADSGNNRVLKEALSGGTYTETQVSSSTLSWPSAVAVDGAGNIYIADSGNNRVLKETLSAGVYTETTVASGSLSWPSAVAVDNGGNVYIADSGNNRVLMESLSGSTYTESTISTSTLNGPQGVTVDSNGNIYIADAGNNRILIEALSSGTYTESTLPTGSLNYPSGVSVDGIGNVFVADSGNSRILKESPSSGTYSESIISSSPLSWPTATAIVGSGNLFISDSYDNRVLKEDSADAPSLTFATTAPSQASSDSPRTVTVQNVGNAVLDFPVPTSGSNPSVAADFSLDSGGTIACPLVTIGPSAGTLDAGKSCLLPISFMPTEAGVFSGSLILTDNSLNASAPGFAQQSIQLGGVGTGSTAQTISFASIAAQSANSVVTLTAMASSGLAVSLISTIADVCTVSGSTASLLRSGTCTIQASQTGDTTFAAAPTVSQSFTVTLASQTITFAPIPASIINTSVPLTLTATASSGLPVSFSSTTPSVCTSSTSASSATLVSVGTCTVQASQSGDGAVFAAAPTVSQSFTVASVNPLTSTGFGAVNIGTTSTAISATLTFNATATVANITVLTQGASGLDFANAGGGSCTVGTSYNAGSSCTVNVTLTPKFAGDRFGAVELSDSSGTAVAMSYLQGSGTGPQVRFLPGTEATIATSTLAYPSNVAVDGNGNIFIVDTGNGRVLKESVSPTGFTESIVATSPLYSPWGIAVDGAGNLYIADTGNSRVLKETASVGGFIESIVPSSTLNWPSGVAVDGSGNVYIADSANQRVLIETYSSGGYVESTVPTSQLNYPGGVGVDGRGNIYIADSGNNRVLIETLSSGSYTESVLPTSALNYPEGITLSGNGDVYIADSYNNRVLKEIPSSGSFIESVVTTASTSGPLGVAVDGGGNIYIADTYNNRLLKEDLADAPSLSFAFSAPGSASSDSPKTVTIENAGNSDLTFPVPSSGNNPSISTNFTLDSSGPSACPVVTTVSSGAGTLAAGGSCVLSIGFSPTVAGEFQGSLDLKDNALNTSAVQSIPVSGTGTGGTGQTITFGAIPTQFANSVLSLTATASSGLSVSYISTTPSICTISGSSAALVSAGTCSIQANQPGSAIYAAAPAVTQSFVVSLRDQTISFPAIPSQIINTSVPLALIATASSGLSVAFNSTTPSVCTVSGSSTTLSSAGTCTIQALQPGDSLVYAAAPTVTQSFTVSLTSSQTPSIFGTVNVGSTGSAVAVSFTFSQAATLGNISVLTQGASGSDFANIGTGSCIVGTGYSTGSSCTVNITFTPSFAGIRYGAAALTDNAGNVVSTIYFWGTGGGPQLIFLPGTESQVAGSGLAYPYGTAVDGSGNIFVADTGNGRVVKETVSAGGFTESTIPTSVLESPSGIAVDGGGNLYIADTNNNRILKETLAGDKYVESILPTSSLAYPSGVAVDGNGNVYIADYGNQRVLLETLSNGIYTESTLPTSALSYPSGVAVDGSGNVYIADTYNSRVLMEALTSSGYTESTIPTSALAFPFGIAVDGRGNIYVADSYNNRVLKESLIGGSYVESVMPSSALNAPMGIAVGGNGNLYIADTYNDRMLKEDLANPPSLNFVLTAPGSTSADSSQTVTVQNIGNDILNFPVPGSGTNPAVSASFALTGAQSCPSVSSGASSSGKLAVGTSCALPISFAPTSSGNASGSLVLTDNSLNVTGSQTVQLNGVGSGSTEQTIAFAPIATQSANTTVALAASASSGLPVSFSSTTPTVCTVAGSIASLNAGGTCTIRADQSGSSSYAPAAPVTQSFAVTLLPQTITFESISSQLINTSVPMALSATASSGLPVSFSSTTPSICSVLSSSASLIATGTCTIQASQPGGGAYAAADPVGQSFAVVSAGSPAGTGFGSVNVGSTGPATAVTLTVYSAATLGSISVSTQGATGLDFAGSGVGTCAVGSSYDAGSTCTVSVTFTPGFAGSRYGAVSLMDDSGNVIATTYLQGTGVGPQVNFMPGTESTIPNSSWYISQIATDAIGNIFIADAGNNTILKETYSSGTYVESTIPTSALQGPWGIAVDGNGNLYIADSGNGRILEESYSSGNYIEISIPTSTLIDPTGVAVDGGGNIYICDTGNNRVLKETRSGNLYTEMVLPTSTLAYPGGLAVDGNGNVYIADTGNNRVLKEAFAAGAYTESTVPTSSLSAPPTVAVDGRGNVFISDSGTSGTGRILKEIPSEGTYTEEIITSSESWSPAVEPDGAGNIYIADSGNGRLLKEDLADSPSLNFAVTVPGSTSSDSPQSVVVENVGNSALTIPVPGSESNPTVSQNFTLSSAGAQSCPLISAGASSAGALAANQSCHLYVAFTPTTSGTLSGTVALSDNALNGTAVQTILLNGTGAGSTQQTITFDPMSSQSQGLLQIVAAASSGLPVTLTSLTPSVCVFEDPTSLWNEIAGTCTIQASQQGDSTYAPAPTVTQSFMVNFLSQTIQYQQLQSQMVNASVPTALPIWSSSGLPITLTSTTPTVCLVPVSASSETPSVNLLTAGTCTVQANQPGDGQSFAPAEAVTYTVTVVAAQQSTSTSFGSQSIGSSGSSLSVSLTLNSASTLDSISVVTQGATALDFGSASGGTCAVGTSYDASSSCTVNVVFTPTAAGNRYGAVSLLDQSGTVVATSYLQGIGLGPQIQFLPGTESTVSTSTLSSPFGVAVDGAGSLYIADTWNSRLIKETLSSGNYVESSIPIGTAYPASVAVDGNGNLYIADPSNNRIMKEVPSAGGYTETVVQTSALNNPSALAVDGSGNLYIADTSNNRVLMESPSAIGYTESTIPTSTLAGPGGVAVDGNGIVYITDTYNSRVLKETRSASGYIESVLPTSAVGPFGIAVDARGNVYISDDYYDSDWNPQNVVLKETLSGGTYAESTLATSSLNVPYGVAADAAGNIYIADSGNNRVLKENFADPPSLSFASTLTGSTSSDSPQTVTVQNVGNAPLDIVAPSTGSNPTVSTNFSLSASSPRSCPVVSAGSSAGVLAAGQYCLLSFSFSPVSTGTLNGTATLTDNALGASSPGFAVQNILLSGTAE